MVPHDLVGKAKNLLSRIIICKTAFFKFNAEYLQH